MSPISNELRREMREIALAAAKEEITFVMTILNAMGKRIDTIDMNLIAIKEQVIRTDAGQLEAFRRFDRSDEVLQRIEDKQDTERASRTVDSLRMEEKIDKVCADNARRDGINEHKSESRERARWLIGILGTGGLLATWNWIKDHWLKH